MTITLHPPLSYADTAPAQRVPEEGARLLPPPGYAIAQLADGRCLPLTVLPLPDKEGGTDRPVSLCELYWQVEPIPPATGDWPRTGPIICDSCAEAVALCKRRAETLRRFLEAGRQATAAECYPERAVWYHDEIVFRLREAGYSWPPSEPDEPCFFVASPTGITAWLDADSLSLPALHLRVEAANPDEMWERLYAAVVAALGSGAVRP